MLSMKNKILKFLFLVTIAFMPLVSTSQIWDSLGTDLRGNCRFHAVHNGKLIVSIRDSVNNMYLSSIGEWDGTSWDTLGAGADGAILSSADYDNKLYLGGSFVYVGGAILGDPRADNLTYWDGSQYYITDYTNPNMPVQALAVYNNELYVGGLYSFIVDSVTYSSIARYNGTAWNDVGGGVFGTFKEIICMTEFNGELIVAGRFDFAGTTQTSNIARWDGTQWQTMGDGLSYYVHTLYVDSVNNELYAGGSFTHSGSTQVNFIAKWDGTTWQPLGNGLGNAVWDIVKYKGQLYVGTSHQLNPAPLMRFDGTNWSPIVPSPNKIVYCLNVYQDALYASGSFDSIGGIPYAGIARYQDTITSLPQQNISEKLFEIFPNPTRDKLEIKLIHQITERFQISISDATGKTVLQKEYSNNSSRMVINLPEELKSGVYTCRIVSGERQYSESFVLQR